MLFYVVLEERRYLWIWKLNLGARICLDCYCEDGIWESRRIINKVASHSQSVLRHFWRIWSLYPNFEVVDSWLESIILKFLSRASINQKIVKIPASWVINSKWWKINRSSLRTYYVGNILDLRWNYVIRSAWWLLLFNFNIKSKFLNILSKLSLPTFYQYTISAYWCRTSSKHFEGLSTWTESDLRR